MSSGHEITGISFGFYDPSDVAAMSVKEINVSLTFDELGEPIPGGLYDPSLGPTSVRGGAICPTCHLNYRSCPGHVGHINLSIPVYNPLTFDALVKLLKFKCSFCHRLKRREFDVRKFVCKIGLIDMGRWKEGLDLEKYLVECDGDLDVAHQTMADNQEKKVKKYEKEIKKYQKNVSSGKKKRIILHTHERMTRQSIIKKFMSNFPHPSRKCENCQAFSPILRKDGYTKIFELELSDGQKHKNEENCTVCTPLDDEKKVKKAMSESRGVSMRTKEERRTATLKDKMEHSSEEEGDSESDSGDDSGSSSDSDSDNDGSTSSSSDEKDDDNSDGRRKKHHSKRERREKYLAPSQVQRHLRLLWHFEGECLSLIWRHAAPSSAAIPTSFALTAQQGVDFFFMRTIPVCPSRFRPPNNMGDMQIEHPLNVYLKKILKVNDEMEAISGTSNKSKKSSGSDNSGTDDDDEEEEEEVNVKSSSDLAKLWIELQEAVNCLLDSSKSSTPDPPNGVRQVLEKKEGLFRRNMMGKRVNFACRSVISPDPYIDTHEVGLPLKFAKKLTFPEPVTPFNFDSLRQMVVNGSEKHPGANYVEDEFGNKKDLSRLDEDQRIALSQTLLTPAPNAPEGKFKIVWRQLVSGDIMLANRQPTLHKPSIMAHVARVLPNPAWQTIRLHYANCNTYNADFDGDEINLHFPQSQLARAEAYHIAQTSHQYIVPTDGSPLRGLIQDHVGGGVLMTSKDTFLSRELYQQLVLSACASMRNGSSHMIIHEPAILKPKVLYTGKQVISTLLDMLMFDPTAPNDRSRDAPPLNMEGKTKLKPDAGWGEKQNEHKVVVRGNWLCQGILDKSQYGASSHGLVHSFYETYGAIKTGSLLTALARLFTTYSQRIGAYTCSIHDMIVKPNEEKGRRELIEESERVGMEAAIEWVAKGEGTFEDEHSKNILRNNQYMLRKKLRDRVFAEGKGYSVLDDVYKKGTMASGSSIIKGILSGVGAGKEQGGLLRKFPTNNMSLMVQTGAKGSMVNHSQISCLLGQQELEGHRVPVMVSGKSLPSFPSFDPRPRAGGFISDRFLTGVRPQDYFFHCMSGREGLVDTAVKTSRSGYLQRCLIKHMEDLKIGYDRTVRDSDGSVIQFQYGEDGIDTTKTPYLGEKEKELDFIVMNMPALMHKFTIDGPDFFNNLNMVNDNYARSKFQEVEQAKKRFLAIHSGASGIQVGDIVKTRRIDTPLVKKQDKDLSFVKEWNERGAKQGWYQGTVVKVRGSRFDIEYSTPIVGDAVFASRNNPWDKNTVSGEESRDGLYEAVVVKENVSDGSFDLKFTGAEFLTDPIRKRVGVHRIKCPTIKRVPSSITVPSKKESGQMLNIQIVQAAIPDPPSSISGTLHVNRHIGAVSERQQQIIDDYCCKPDKKKLLEEYGLNQATLEILIWVKSMRSNADPGEAVGALAGQSIGEPSTQMTLNTFHLAGVGGGNVTLGIPRLREILMTAAKTLKTPLMYLPVDPRIATAPSATNENGNFHSQGKALAEDLSAKLGILNMDLLLNHNRNADKYGSAIVVRENIHRSHRSSPAERRYIIRLRLAKLKAISKTYNIDFEAIKNAFGMVFLPKLLTKCGHALRQSGAITSISQVTGGTKKSLAKKEEDQAKSQADVAMDSEGDNDSGDEGVDDVEQGTLSFGKRKEIIAYGDDDDDDNGESGGSSSSSSSSSSSDDDDDANSDVEMTEKEPTSKSNNTFQSNRVASDDSVYLTSEVASNVQRSPMFCSATACKSPSKSKSGDAWMQVTLTTPVGYKKIMMLALVEELVKEVLIFSTKNIKNTYVLPPARGTSGDKALWRVQTDGVNFQAAWKMMDIGVNPNTIASNDINAILETYGVEAARASIVSEVLSVFGVYGIEVDPRHLALIADYMTFEGTYRAMNRLGIGGSASPFLKMSFETSMNFLTAATTRGSLDNGESPSARIVLGRVVANGTGSCGVRMNWDMMQIDDDDDDA